MGLEILSGLLDEKLISIISVFVKYPDKRFYLSEVSKLSGVNNTSTFRILNRLSTQEIIKSTVIGRVRVYQLARGDRALALTQLLKKEVQANGLEEFVSRVKALPRIRLIALDTKTASEAKVIVVGEFSSKERIERICREIQAETGYKIEFVELNVQQFEGLRTLQSFGSGRKILYKK